MLLLFVLPSAFGIRHFPAFAAEPTTQPATQPAIAFRADSPYRKWFKQLADPDPKVRAQAQVDLMGMSADELAAFRQLIATSRPLAPSQAESLCDIVKHVYLAGQRYVAAGGVATDASGSESPYFLGVVWPPDFEDQPGRLGVPILQRLPGFPSFRYLRDGDMILSVQFSPSLGLERPPDTATRVVSDLTTALAQLPQPQDIVLQVLRDGEVIRIPLRLAPRPMESTRDGVIAFMAPRLRDADNYWNENFQQLVDQEKVVDAE